MLIEDLGKVLRFASRLYEDCSIECNGILVSLTSPASEIKCGDWSVNIFSNMSMSLDYKDRLIASNIDDILNVKVIEDDELYETGLYNGIIGTLNKVLYNNRKDFSENIKDIENMYNYYKTA